MKLFPSLCSLLILAGFTSSGLAQTTIAWKFKEGQVFWVKQERKTVQTVDVKDSLLRQEMKSAQVFRFEVKKIDLDGKLVLEQKIESIHVSAEQTPAAFKDYLKRLTGGTLTFHLDGQFHITKVEGYDALVKQLAKGELVVEEMARAVVPEDTFRAGVKQLFDFLPKKPIGKGASWQTTESEAFGLLGTLKVVNAFTLGEIPAGKADSVKILGTQKMTFELPKNNKAIPFEVKTAQVKKADSKLEILFDLSREQLQKRTLNRQVQIQFGIVKDKRMLEMLVDQDTVVTVEVLDKKPSEK